MVLDLIVILTEPSNPTPLINLVVSNFIVLSANPLRLPLTRVVDDKVIPATNDEKPTIELAVEITNDSEEHTPITTPVTYNKITGCVIPSVSSNVVELAFVVPYPTTPSGPIKIQSVSRHTYY